MRNKTRPISIILLVAILGFMLASLSCTPKTEAKLQAASAQYTDATGITPVQSVGLLSKWFSDYAATKAANTPPVAIPAEPAK